jgi:hypothetical protein
MPTRHPTALTCGMTPSPEQRNGRLAIRCGPFTVWHKSRDGAVWVFTLHAKHDPIAHLVQRNPPSDAVHSRSDCTVVMLLSQLHLP